jgi:hypothetical protein
MQVSMGLVGTPLCGVGGFDGPDAPTDAVACIRFMVLFVALQVSQLWKEVVTKLGAEYPDVELSHMYIDNAAMQLIRNPKYFDVIVTGKGRQLSKSPQMYSCAAPSTK